MPECHPQPAIGNIYHHAEPNDGGTLDRVREVARRHKLLIVWPRAEYDPAKGLRGTSILINRDAEVLGRYDKMFPTVGEMAAGCAPGTECTVFETDFGKVGMLIRFDLNFPEVHEALAKGKPDVVAFSSSQSYRGGLQARALAFEPEAFVVTSITNELGLVIGRCGRVLKESTAEALAAVPININSEAMHIDFNQTKMDAMFAKYGRELTFDFHTREALFVVEFTGGRDIGTLTSEFDLDSADTYWARSRKTRAEAPARFQNSREKAKLFFIIFIHNIY